MQVFCLAGLGHWFILYSIVCAVPSHAIPYKNSAKSQMKLLELKSQYLKRKITDGLSRLSTTEKDDLEGIGSRHPSTEGKKGRLCWNKMYEIITLTILCQPYKYIIKQTCVRQNM